MVTHILQGYSKNKAYIIAQSPMDNTVKDFWKMIVNYQVSAIVMMCDEFETQQVNESQLLYLPKEFHSVLYLLTK